LFSTRSLIATLKDPEVTILLISFGIFQMTFDENDPEHDDIWLLHTPDHDVPESRVQAGLRGRRPRPLSFVP
jgi:hypothetical protein